MRKKSIKYLADTIFWYLIYFLPVILYGVYLLHGSESGTILSFNQFITTNEFGLSSTNIVLTTINSLFGASGILPLFSSASGFYAPVFIGTWFVNTYLLHLVIDVILFIPRWGHRMMDKFCKED